MSIYEVFYLEEEVIDDGYIIQQHIPVKYFQNKEDTEKYCIEHNDHDYVWQEIEVE